MPDFLTKYGPWALVIGGSEGIGASFARKLAERGLNLVLVARKKRELEETAVLIRKLGVQVLTLSTDVSKPREALARRCVRADRSGSRSASCSIWPAPT